MVHYGFVAVHLGAGRHSLKTESAYKKLCKVSCEKGAALINDGLSALDTACEVMCILEDSPLTNAGYGSNLNHNGEAECDAGIMISSPSSKKTQFGAVSSLTKIRNPILAAKEIILYQNEPRHLGRTPPMLLVGDGANTFANERGLQLIENKALISEKALGKYKKYKDKLELSKSLTLQQLSGVHYSSSNQAQDTVGVICIDKHGNIASASSSGGIALKLPGRVGQVPMYGCGCWAQHSRTSGVAVITSGCGEQLIQTMLAKSLGQTILKEGDPAFRLKDLMDSYFIHPEMLSEEDARMGGVLVAYYDGKTVDFNVAFTTDSMVFGFATTNQEKPSVRVSRNSYERVNFTQTDVGFRNTRLTMEGFVVKLK